MTIQSSTIFLTADNAVGVPYLFDTISDDDIHPQAGFGLISMQCGIALSYHVDGDQRDTITELGARYGLPGFASDNVFRFPKIERIFICRCRSLDFKTTSAAALPQGR